MRRRGCAGEQWDQRLASGALRFGLHGRFEQSQAFFEARQNLAQQKHLALGALIGIAVRPELGARAPALSDLLALQQVARFVAQGARA